MDSYQETNQSLNETLNDNNKVKMFNPASYGTFNDHSIYRFKKKENNN